MRTEENMEYTSQSNPYISRCIRNNTKEIKATVAWHRDWEKNSGIAENYCRIFCKDPPKCSWCLRSLVDTESQEI